MLQVQGQRASTVKVRQVALPWVCQSDRALEICFDALCVSVTWSSADLSDSEFDSEHFRAEPHQRLAARLLPRQQLGTRELLADCSLASWETARPRL